MERRRKPSGCDGLQAKESQVRKITDPAASAPSGQRDDGGALGRWVQLSRIEQDDAVKMRASVSL